MNLVVRGADLRPSTPIQRLLQELLGLPEPHYLHHPLVTHEDGRRLAKRDLGPTLAASFEYHDGRRRCLTEIAAQHERSGAPAEADKVRRELAQVPGPAGASPA